MNTARPAGKRPGVHHLHLPFLTFVLLCLPFADVVAADEPVEVPEWVMTGIAAVETSSDYSQGRLILYRNRHDGPSGEVGPWQLSPSVLHDLGFGRERAVVRKDVGLAEYLTRTWLLRCHQRTGDWDAAVAMYHVGPRGDLNRGRDYAERVRAIGLQEGAEADNGPAEGVSATP